MMENKCQKCFYYRLCVQHDYIVEDEKKKSQIIIVEYMKMVFHQSFGMKKKNVKNLLKMLKNKGIKVYYPLILKAYMGII